MLVDESAAGMAKGQITARAPADRPVRVIEPRQPGLAERAREFWRYRGLLPYFAQRLVEKRYVRTWLGWLWLPLRPILDITSRVFVFGTVLGVGAGKVPYLLFLIVGMSGWRLFATTTYWATRSLELHRGFLKRIYVPRLTILLAALAPGAVEYGIYLAITVVVLGWYVVADGAFHLEFGLNSFALLAGVLIVLWFALAIGLWTSVYGAQARDVRFSLNYVLGFWFFLTPVVYPLSAVPEGARAIVNLNPMTAPIELFKHGMFGTGLPSIGPCLVTTAVITVLTLGGMWFFSRSEALALDHV